MQLTRTPPNLDNLHRHVPAAIELLGWEGTVIGPVVMLGRRVAVVARLLPEIHRKRMAGGWRPVADWCELERLMMPELALTLPEPAVSLVGVLAPARHWATARVGAAPFTSMAPTAVLLPRHAAQRIPRTEQVGVVAVTGDVVDVLRNPPASRPVPDRRPHRRVLEIVYSLVIEGGKS